MNICRPGSEKEARSGQAWKARLLFAAPPRTIAKCPLFAPPAQIWLRQPAAPRLMVLPREGAAPHSAGNTSAGCRRAARQEGTQQQKSASQACSRQVGVRAA